MDSWTSSPRILPILTNTNTPLLLTLTLGLFKPPSGLTNGLLKRVSKAPSLAPCPRPPKWVTTSDTHSSTNTLRRSVTATMHPHAPVVLARKALTTSSIGTSPGVVPTTLNTNGLGVLEMVLLILVTKTLSPLTLWLTTNL